MVRYCVGGNDYEFIDWSAAKHADANYWDPNVWKEEHGKFYTETVYPHAALFLKELCPSNASILELCAGDGELAELAFSETEDRIARYTLVDLNRESCEMATKRLDDKIKEGRAQVHQADIGNADFETMTQGNVDWIVGSGALTKEVLPDRETALKALDRVVPLLKTGGRILLTGLADHWICADDLRERGFTVENTSSPYEDLQVYVAKKD
jgi:SAM-dependent methyltransferase